MINSRNYLEGKDKNDRGINENEFKNWYHNEFIIEWLLWQRFWFKRFKDDVKR